MFANIRNGPQARNELDSAFSVHRNGIADARHYAMTLAIGAARQAADPPRPLRPHRGMLPDVDMSRVVPDPNYRPLLGRLIGLVGRLAGRLGSARPAARTMSGDGP